MLTHLLPVGGIALACLLGNTATALGFTPRPAASLTKKLNTFIGCSDKQKSKAGQTLADIASLASWAYTEASIENTGKPTLDRPPI